MNAAKDTVTALQEHTSVWRGPRDWRGNAVVVAISVAAVVALTVQAAPGAEDANGGSATARIAVTNQVLNPVDDRLFGQFMERPGFSGETGPEAALMPGTHALQPQAERLIAEMRIPVLRFPGGTDVDHIDWTDMIDNAPGRDPNRPISQRKEGNSLNNCFGYDEFLQLCQRNGSEAIVVVNFRDGLLGVKKLDEAALHAARLVAYCNAPADANLPNGLGNWATLRARNGHAAPYGVKYFQIGNEAWFFEKEAKKNSPGDCVDRWVGCVKAYVEAMRLADAKIKIIVDCFPLEVSARVHRELGDAIYAYAVHRYHPWQLGGVTRDGSAVDANALSAEEIWLCWTSFWKVDADGQSRLEERGFEQARKLGCKVTMTEWNWAGWWAVVGQTPAFDSAYAKAVGAASFLHAIIRNGDLVCMANQSMLIGKCWGINAIRVEPNGQTPAYMYPSGMVTMMYSQHHGDKLLKTELESMPCYEQPYQMGSQGEGFPPAEKVAYVDVVATRAKDKLFVHMINRRFAGDQPIEIDLSAFQVAGGEGKQYILEGRLNDKPEPGQPLEPAQIRQDAVKIGGKVLKLKLPQRSVTIFEVPIAGW